MARTLLVSRQLLKSTTLDIGHAFFINPVGDKPCCTFVFKHAQLLGKSLARKLAGKRLIVAAGRPQQSPQHRKDGNGSQQRCNNPKSGFVSHRGDCTD